MRGKKYATDAERVAARRSSIQAYKDRNPEKVRAWNRAAADRLTPEQVAARAARWAEHGRKRDAADPEGHTARSLRWHRAHPDARLAHKAVGRALTAGKLVRGPCAVCGAPKAQAHHPRGYGPSHRLDVEWLCPTHHRRAHRVNSPA